MNWDELVRKLETAHTCRQRIGLFFGLRGGSELLGHDLPELLGKALVKVPSGNDLDLARPARQARGIWRDMLPDQRRAILYDSTVPRQPDDEAIAIICAMLREEYLHSVLLTDPHHGLYDRLRALGKRDGLFECASMHFVDPANAQSPSGRGFGSDPRISGDAHGVEYKCSRRNA